MQIRPILSALSRSKTGALLIAAQIALTLAIICNALFVVHDRIDQSMTVSGVDEENLFYITASTPDYSKNPFAIQRQDEALLESIPGVIHAGWTNQIPLDNSGSNTAVGNEKDPDGYTAAAYAASKSFIDLLGLKLIDGRDFVDNDYIDLDQRISRDGPDVVIITQALAQRLYPDSTSVIGKPLYLVNDDSQPPVTIVGVVERLVSPWGRADWNPSDPQGSSSYIAPVRFESQGIYLVRTEPGQRDSVMKQAEDKLKNAVAGRIILTLRSMNEVRELRYSNDLYLATLLSIVVALLLLMTASGIIGLASLWVTQRRKQIGIRRALGARQIDIVNYFVTENILITSTGIVFGVALAIALNSTLLQLTSIERLPAQLLIGASLTILLLGTLAVLGPAIRASKVSPAEATRSI